MRKNQAVQLVGRVINFRRDRAMFSDAKKVLYNWREGDSCKVCGLVEFEEGSPRLLIGYDFIGEGESQTCELLELPFSDVEKELVLDGQLFSVTKLAIADRRQANV